ncbi:GapA-binding peptide SR1P [Bacillus cereus group sp. MYBK15-3]|nr:MULTISPECIES: GapA-binding peptide SR1P [Bacillus cereus group]USL06683.1 GapA-binding peptide SR1P [Bacillus bombysepticus]HDR4681975.1 GapA-binding peptide SR1P [Bacillus cereus]
MGTIVCQVCEGTIGHFEDEKTTVLYGKCGTNCDCARKDDAKA